MSNQQFFFSCNISNTKDSVLSGYPNTEKRVENATHGGVYLYDEIVVFHFSSQSSKSLLLGMGIQTSLTVAIFFVLT